MNQQIYTSYLGDLPVDLADPVLQIEEVLKRFFGLHQLRIIYSMTMWGCSFGWRMGVCLRC